MDTPQKPKRPARRKKAEQAGRKRLNGTSRTVTVDDEAYLQLEVIPAKLRLTKSAYASAAVRYFADQGLDPTRSESVATLQELVKQNRELSLKIDSIQETARKQSADIGNRLVGMWRVLEKNLYTHLATEQSALLLYLEAIEGNIMNTIVGTESEYLWPLMERVIRGATDSLMGRRMTSDVLERMADPKVPEYRQAQVNNEYSEDREKEVVRVSREVLAAIKLDRKVSKRPELSVAPITTIPAGKPEPSSS